MLWFQFLLFGLLFGPVFVSGLGMMAAWAVWILAVLATTALVYLKIPKGQKAPAAVMGATYAFLSGAWVFALEGGIPVFYALTSTFVGWIALYAWLKKTQPTMAARVLAYDNGYAVVRIEPAVVSWVPPGEYAVTSRKRVKKNQRVQVQFSTFSRSGRIA